MKTYDVKNLLNRAAAVIDSPNSERATDRAALVADLQRAAEYTEKLGALVTQYQASWEFAQNALSGGAHDDNFKYFDGLIESVSQELRLL